MLDAFVGECEFGGRCPSGACCLGCAGISWRRREASWRTCVTMGAVDPQLHLKILLDALNYLAATETVVFLGLCARLSMANEGGPNGGLGPISHG